MAQCRQRRECHGFAAGGRTWNNDGRTDLFVANDTVQNFPFVDRDPLPNGRWKWDEIGLQSGVGFSESGQPRSGMGVDAADIFGTGGQGDRLIPRPVELPYLTFTTKYKNGGCTSTN